MKKTAKIAALLLAAIVFVSISPTGAASYSSLTGFLDVDQNAWYSQYLDTVVSGGIMNGMSSSYFGVNEQITLAQTVTIAARLHRMYYTGKDDLVQGKNVWYSTYVDYAIENGIISTNYTYAQYGQAVTKGQFAVILAAAYPNEAMKAINTVDYIPDVSSGSYCYSAVLLLYRAGICTGNESGDYEPDKNIRRCEAAAVITRQMEPSKRLSVTFKGEKELSFYSGQYSVQVGKTITILVYSDGGELSFSLSGDAAKIERQTSGSVTIAGVNTGSCTVTVTDSAGHTADCALTVHRSSLQGRSLSDLISEGAIQVSAVINSIQSATLVISNTSSGTVSYRITPGSYLEPSNKSYQRMLILSLPKGDLAAGKSVTLSMDVACMDFKCILPDSRTQYTFCSGEDGNAAVIAEYFDLNRTYSFAVRQAAVWIVQDNVSYAECGTLISTVYDSNGSARTQRTISSEDYSKAQSIVAALIK